MKNEIKQRIDEIQRGEVPDGYKKDKIGIAPKGWNEKKLAPYIKEYKEKTVVANQYPILTSSRRGLLLQTDYYANRQVTTEDNIGYNVLPYGYITFRSRSDDGRFRFNRNIIVSKGIISYFYPVFSFSENASSDFMIALLNETIYKKMYPYAEGTAQIVLSMKKLGAMRYYLPPLPEQQKIAEILTTQDKVIDLKEKRIAEKQRQKKYLMQQLLTGKRRLRGFSGEWITQELGAMFSERIEKNCEDLQLLAITGTKGVVPRTELDLKDNSSEDKSKYLRICAGDIGYNTMRMWQGVSAYSNYERAL